VVAFPEADNVRDALVAGVRSLGWICDVASTEAALAGVVAGGGALAAGKTPPPDLAIVDLRHPKLIDGEAFCR